MMLHSCQTNAALSYVRVLHKTVSLHGKNWLYARNVILSKKTYYCIRHILEGLKRNARGHAEICLLSLYSSRGCVVFSPMVFSNFLGGCQTMKKSIKHAQLDDIQRCG